MPGKEKIHVQSLTSRLDEITATIRRIKAHLHRKNEELNEILQEEKLSSRAELNGVMQLMCTIRDHYQEAEVTLNEILKLYQEARTEQKNKT